MEAPSLGQIICIVMDWQCGSGLDDAISSVTQRARQIGCSRQTIYKHKRHVTHAVQEGCAPGPSRAELLAEMAQLRSENQQLWEWLYQSIEFRVNGKRSLQSRVRRWV